MGVAATQDSTFDWRELRAQVKLGEVALRAPSSRRTDLMQASMLLSGMVGSKARQSPCRMLAGIPHLDSVEIRPRFDGKRSGSISRCFVT
jgi:hypothetical protein